MPRAPRGRRDGACGPYGMAWAGNGPSNAPTGRALTKGIWSFFQNKYKNHVKPLDPRRAAACWKCHVAPHGVSVIKGLGVSRKHPKSEEGGHGQRALPGVGVRLQPRGRAGISSAMPVRTTLNELPLHIWKICTSYCCGSRGRSWAGKGLPRPLTPVGLPRGVSRASLCFVSSPHSNFYRNTMSWSHFFTMLTERREIDP